MSLPYILTPEAKTPAAERLRALIRDGKPRLVRSWPTAWGPKRPR